MYVTFSNFISFENRVDSDKHEASADPESFFRGSPTLGMFFLLVDVWIQIQLKSGHHRPSSETPFKWRFADDGPVLNVGLVAL